jgi:glycosyltransferase involved in cell wall biosynthesis
MKILMISTDARICDAESSVARRMQEYGNLCDELHIVVFCKKNVIYPRPERIRIEKQTWVYPTWSRYKWCFIWDGLKTAKTILNKEEAWVITTQDPFESGVVGFLLVRNFPEARLQVQAHTDFLSPFFRAESLKNRFRGTLARFSIRRADSIRVVSERIKQSIIIKYGVPSSQIVTLPIFVDVKKIREVPPTLDLRKKYAGKSPIFLIASRLTKEKNIPLALRAFREVCLANPNALLVIVGEGPEKSKIQLLITRYQLQKNVILEPWTDDLSSHYKTADCFLLTSNYEGYGRTIVEALAAGCPVISSDVGVAREAITPESGSIFTVGNSHALALLLKEVMQGKKFQPTLPKKFDISKEEYLQQWQRMMSK